MFHEHESMAACGVSTVRICVGVVIQVEGVRPWIVGVGKEGPGRRRTKDSGSRWSLEHQNSNRLLLLAHVCILPPMVINADRVNY